jgi:hypothetical protein
MIADLLVTSGSFFAPTSTSTVGRFFPSYFPIHLIFIVIPHLTERSDETFSVWQFSSADRE